MNSILEMAREVTTCASAQGVLHPLSTRVEHNREQIYDFTLRIAINLRKKQHAATGALKINPFLPYEEALYVTALGPEHVCILNKYNVLPEHLLIITRQFESQESALTEQDFAALMMIMGQSGGLGFFNGGKIAGASQAHKHLQWVPADEEQFPLLSVECPPFLHQDQPLNRLDGKTCYEAYTALAREQQWQPGKAFNLLITRERMRWIPRQQAEIAGTSINSLGFAGSFFVPDDGSAEKLRRHGLMTALCQASGYPALSPD